TNAVSKAGYIKGEPIRVPSKRRWEVARGAQEIPPLDAAGAHKAEFSFPAKAHQIVRAKVTGLPGHAGAHLPGQARKGFAPFGHRAAIGRLRILREQTQ